MPTIRQVYQLIQQGNYAFSIDFRDAYLHIPVVKYHHFLHIVISGKFYNLGLLQALQFSLHNWKYSKLLKQSKLIRLFLTSFCCLHPKATSSGLKEMLDYIINGN